VITGTVRSPVGSGTPSAALRWDDNGVSFIESGGLETKGIAIDNLGGVVINGYFDGGSLRAPAVVQLDGFVNILAVPPQYLSGASATTMSRSGLVAGYYYDMVGGTFGIKAVAWPNGVFTPLEMPAGQRYAFPSGVGSNGLVFGSATDGVTGSSVGGFWALDVEDSQLRSATVSGARGQAVELSAESFRASGANVGHSVAARVNNALIGQAITDSTGRARLVFTIPADFAGSQMTVRYTDENGASIVSVIEVTSGCVPADLNCDGSVNALDLAALLAAWGSSGPADLNGDGAVNSPDIAFLLSGWTG
jgi:hypothetical protein